MEILNEIQAKEYEVKASEIAKQLGVSKVHPIVFVKPNTEPKEFIICYLKEPKYITKLIAMDKAQTHGNYISANELMNELLIKEHSDALTYSESDESDAYKLGICDYILSNLITIYINQFKKK